MPRSAFNKTINRTTLSVVRFAHNTTLSSARLLWRYTNIMKRLLFIFILSVTSFAHSGGMRFQIEINKFERISKLQATANVSFLKGAEYFNDCKEIEILFSFDHKKMETTSLKHFLDPEKQEALLNKIEARSKQIKPIMALGSMGYGFKSVSSCKYESSGLAELGGINSSKVIYSFYNPV